MRSGKSVGQLRHGADGIRLAARRQLDGVDGVGAVAFQPRGDAQAARLQITVFDCDLDQRAFLFVEQMVGRGRDVRHAQLYGGFQFGGDHAACNDVGVLGVAPRLLDNAGGFGGLQFCLGLSQRRLDLARLFEQRFQLC
jgi:hypothetical protein